MFRSSNEIFEQNDIGVYEAENGIARDGFGTLENPAERDRSLFGTGQTGLMSCVEAPSRFRYSGIVAEKYDFAPCT